MDIQKAGEGSTQIQANNITFIQGIDEKRAREIYIEQYVIAKRDLTEEAVKIANERVKSLEESLIPKMEAIDNGLKAFADPGFQLLLIEAQKTAASTERSEDYDLLAELLIHRIEKGQDRKIRTGIHRAIEIIEDIPDDALLGLTLMHAYNTFVPKANDILEILDKLNNLFSKIIYGKLPYGIDWIENLDILDAVRINPVKKFISVRECYSKAFMDLMKIGIKKDSEDFNKAIQLMSSVNLPLNIFTENKLLPGYFILALPYNTPLDDIVLFNIKGQNIIQYPLNTEQKNVIKEIMALYSNDGDLKKEIESHFHKEWDKRPYLKQLEDWVSNIPNCFEITMVGKVLAHANAQRCDKTLPPLN